jgi:hypothetical protein
MPPRIDFRVNYVEIRYSYGKKSMRQAYMDVGYSYGSQVYEDITAPFVGFKAPATQSIANNLPPWMLMRQSEDTHGWKLMNSYGMSYENTVDLIDKHLRNMFLATTDRWQRFRYYRGELFIDELFEFVGSRNLLSNSSFSQPDIARLRLPADWTDNNKPTTQAVFLDDSTVLRGTYSVRMDAAATLNQITSISSLGPVQTMTASVYVRSDEAVDVSLVLSVQGIDTSVVSGETRFVDTLQGWQRISVSLSVNMEVFESQVSLRSNSAATVYFDCAQVEESVAPTDWQASDLDKLVYLDGAVPIRFVQANSNNDSVTIFPIGNVPEFSEVLVPTRISAAQPRPVALEPFSSSTLGRRVTFFNTITSVNWEVVDNQVVASDADNRFEIFNQYDIRELRYFQGLGYGTVDDTKATVVPLTSAVRDDLLFVVAKETFRGRTIRTLKVLTARKPPDDQTYLESFVDFELDLGFDTTYGSEALTDEVYSIGFSERDPSWMVVDTTQGRRFYFRLFYDYYTVNLSNRAIYTLERYDNAQLQVA